MNEDNRNLFLAIGLSLVVIIAWNFFYAMPQANKAQQAGQASQTQQAPQVPGQNPNAVTPASPAANPENPGLPSGGPAAPELAVTRDQALARSPRVAIDTPSIAGSIALKGGVVDDVSLKDYRETLDPSSPHIVLLSPMGAPQPYYAEFGFIPEHGASIALPSTDTLWTADGKELTPSTPVTLTWDNGQGLVFHRKISVDASYMFTIEDSVENNGSAPLTLTPYAVVSRYGTPKVSGYAVLFEGMLGVAGDGGVQELTYAQMEKEPNNTRALNGTGGWIGFTDKYWAATLIPDQKSPVQEVFSMRGTTVKTYQTDVLNNAVTIAPGASATSTTRLFAGAKVNQTIDSYQTSFGIKNYDRLIDWGWFYFITKPLFRLIDLIYHLVGNFGIAIMIVTVLLKAAFFPLANRSFASMARMKAVQPQMNAIKERYPDDKQKQQQEVMELYKREKVNPVAGCLPLVIQIPVFFALYKVIFVTIEMRQAPFFGWIRDLSAPDPTNVFTLFGLIPYDPTQVPFIGHFLAIGIWPIIMGFTQFIQMKMNPEPPDPVQKQMFNWMPVIFTFMLGTFPAGLVIYWTWNNSLSIIQQGVMIKKTGGKIELWDNLRKLLAPSKKK
ncbi:MAG TPA: membrane protein insertase YidC [Beijerinckiaceae bacterium]|nr:membrane protein insertase YidC [Beijerinckiaceae bacterium]